MNISLNQILKLANDIHLISLNNQNSITISDYINSIQKLRAYIEQMKSVTQRVESIHKICSEKIQNCTAMDENYVNQKIRCNNMMLGISSIEEKSETSKCIAPCIKTDVTIVKDIDMIPNTGLYWANDEFAIRINNILIKGNVGDIYVDKNMQCKKINNCILGSNCKNNNCTYYHNDDKIRNFLNSSWNYTPDIIKKNNMNMRHIGDRNRLHLDISRLLKCDEKVIQNEIDIRINQLMHDLLILMALKDKGFIF